ncbi:MAG: TolC family protein, partial [Chitinophagaceae bacterium]
TAQTTISLADVQQLAAKNFPLAPQQQLYEQAKKISIEALNSQFLPQINVHSFATYQSDVTRLPVSLPDITFTPPNNDQYRIYADIQQLLYDGKQVSLQKELTGNQHALLLAQNKVQQHQLYGIINKLYLGILVTQLQLQQTNNYLRDLTLTLKTIQSKFENGVSTKNNWLILQAQAIQTEQKQTEILSAKNSLLQILSLYTGKQYDSTTQLAEPLIGSLTTNNARPELQLFQLQENNQQLLSKISTSKLLPRVQAFAQTGYGNPALNMLMNQFTGYYTAGVKMQWSLAAFYNHKKEKKLQQIEQSIINTNRQQFLLTTQTEITEQQSALQKLLLLQQSDEQLISLRTQLKTNAETQLQAGTINANDYLKELNALDAALLQKQLHRIQYIQTYLTINYLNGNHD